MSTARRTAGLSWLSFHIFLPGAFETFLLNCFLPMLEEELSSGRVKRFFFIRYSEKGHHIRLRFLPQPGTEAVMIEQRLSKLLQKFAAETGTALEPSILERHQYDRSNLYFGETIQSVYAELLNEQTSYLCLRLLRAQLTSRFHLMLVVSSAMGFLLRHCEGNWQSYKLALDDSRAFAARGVKKLGHDVALLPDSREGALYRALTQSMPKITASLDGDATINRIVRLLRRTRKGIVNGRHVAAHALHLFCNKMGLSFIDEFEIFDMLYNIAVDEDRET